MGAIVTVTPFEKRSPQRIGVRLQWEGNITGPASYDAGGSVLDPKLLGMTKITGGIGGVGSAGRVAQIIPQADGTAKVQVRTSNGAAPAALADFTAAGNLSAETYSCIILGR